MGKYSTKSETADRDGTLSALRKALRQRSAQQLAEADEPALPATGTERIARVLAEAKRDQSAQRRLRLSPRTGRVDD